MVTEDKGRAVSLHQLETDLLEAAIAWREEHRSNSVATNTADQLAITIDAYRDRIFFDARKFKLPSVAD
jgi:hypothetical protein